MLLTPPPSLPFGDFLVFVDESGDHELIKIDPQYPVFVLLFVILRKDDYVERICRDLQQFKFEFWGHDEVVLHEHEIRKPFGDFLFLIRKSVRDRFLGRLSQLMEELPATVIAVIIDKPSFVARYVDPVGPYSYAMQAGLERVFRYLEANRQSTSATTVIVERRGPREDTALELAFRRVCDGANAIGQRLPLQLVMVSKASNCAGLQFADLMARPVGLHHLRPDQPNRAFGIIEPKLRRSPAGKVEGWGLKRLP